MIMPTGKKFLNSLLTLRCHLKDLFFLLPAMILQDVSFPTIDNGEVSSLLNTINKVLVHVLHQTFSKWIEYVLRMEHAEFKPKNRVH